VTRGERYYGNSFAELRTAAVCGLVFGAATFAFLKDLSGAAFSASLVPLAVLPTTLTGIVLSDRVVRKVFISGRVLQEKSVSEFTDIRFGNGMAGVTLLFRDGSSIRLLGMSYPMACRLAADLYTVRQGSSRPAGPGGTRAPTPSLVKQSSPESASD
jgi:hypothetical protein